MIVYGFYGTGKSYACITFPRCYDHDFHVFRFQPDLKDFRSTEKAYIKRLKMVESQYDIVFINHVCKEIKPEKAFIQSNYQECLRRLKERNQGNFIPDQQEYESIRKYLVENCSNTVLLEKGRYITDYLHI